MWESRMGEFSSRGDEIVWAGNGKWDGHKKRGSGIMRVKKRLSGQAKSARERGIRLDGGVRDGGGKRRWSVGRFRLGDKEEVIG